MSVFTTPSQRQEIGASEVCNDLFYYTLNAYHIMSCLSCISIMLSIYNLSNAHMEMAAAQVDMRAAQERSSKTRESYMHVHCVMCQQMHQNRGK
jgi:hypothetical protein